MPLYKDDEVYKLTSEDVKQIEEFFPKYNKSGAILRVTRSRYVERMQTRNGRERSAKTRPMAPLGESVPLVAQAIDENGNRVTWRWSPQPPKVENRAGGIVKYRYEHSGRVYKDGFRFHPGKDNEELWFLLTKSNRISNALSPCKKPLHFFDRPEIVAKQEKETITQEQKLFKAIIDKPNEESVRAIYNAVGLPEEENFDVVQTALWKWAKASKDNEKRFWELDADAGFRQYLENIEEGKRLKVLTNNPDGWRVKGVPGKWMGVMTEHQLAKKLVDDTVKYKILLNAIEHAPEQVEV